MHRLHVRAHITTHDVGMFFDILACGRGAGMLKHQAHFRDVRDDRQPFLFSDKTRWRIDDRGAHSAGQGRAESLGSASYLD